MFGKRVNDFLVLPTTKEYIAALDLEAVQNTGKSGIWFRAKRGKNLVDNFQHNADQFEEGKHFLRIDGNAFRTFKDGLPDEIGEPLAGRR